MPSDCIRLYENLVQLMKEKDDLNSYTILPIISALLWNFYEELDMSPTHIANEIESSLEVYIAYDKMERNSKT